MERDPYLGNDLAADRKEVLLKLGLSEFEFEELMDLPPKRHEDYPSNRFFFEGLSSVRRLFKKIATRA